MSMASREKLADFIGKTIARQTFEKRGHAPEHAFTEVDLTDICKAAAWTALETKDSAGDVINKLADG